MYYLSNLYFAKWKIASATYLSTLRKQRDHGALPPSSEIMPKHDEYLGGIGKKYING
jgi:hypothetical protein